MQAELTPHGDVKVKDIVAIQYGFAVLKTDGSVVTFGESYVFCTFINSVGENPDQNDTNVQKLINEILPLIKKQNGVAIRAMPKNMYGDIPGFIVTAGTGEEIKVDLPPW